MMPVLDPELVRWTLQVSAVISVSELAKPATKDACNAVKDKAAEIWGLSAIRVIAHVEIDPGSAEAKAALHTVIPAVDDADAAELKPLLEALAKELKIDDAARAEAEQAQVRLKLEMGSSAFIGKVLNDENFDNAAEAEGDFRPDELKMAERRRVGNS